jgi:hypothetical protein
MMLSYMREGILTEQAGVLAGALLQATAVRLVRLSC